MKQYHIYVEGGGNSKTLRTECREGFKKFLKKAGLSGSMTFIACGGRGDAFNLFEKALKDNDKIAFLLVDSENAVDASHQSGKSFSNWKPWEHLQKKDNWKKPANAEERQCHLMVQCMENWFLADTSALKEFYGSGYQEKKCPSSDKIEAITKEQVHSRLKNATDNCSPGKYNKGKHSFKILELLKPELVCKASPWAQRLIEELKQHAQLN